MRRDMSYLNGNINRQFMKQLLIFERNFMEYTRINALKPPVTVVTFNEAKEGVGYKDPSDGSIRVKIGEIYLRFTVKGIVEGYLPIYWRIGTLSSEEIQVNLTLSLKGIL